MNEEVQHQNEFGSKRNGILIKLETNPNTHFIVLLLFWAQLALVMDPSLSGIINAANNLDGYY